MRIIFLLLLISIGSIKAIEANSQSAKVLISSKSLKLGALLESIESQTNYLFTYNAEDINTERYVTVKNKKTSVEELLTNTFAGTNISYSMMGNNIMLKKNEVMVTSIQQSDNIKVKGTVRDEKGEVIIGASIMIKGGKQGTITDVSGNYELDTPKNARLIFSYIGYKAVEQAVNGQPHIDVVMQDNLQNLDEVVVVGFGTQKKANLTGAVGSIKTEEALKSRPVTNVQELLAGAVPGMLVTKGSGAVGSGAQINIRGTSTIGGSSGVLILIDGVPGNINTLNPNDIESVSVLKDAASASIYGSRAANGVVLVTTKAPSQQGRPVVELSSSVGIQNPQHKIDFVNASDYMKVYDQARLNDGATDVTFGEKGQEDLRKGLYGDFPWYKEIYKKSTLVNNNYVALSGRENSIVYRVSVSNDNQTGTLPNNKYTRLIIKPNFTFKLRHNLELQANLQYTQTKIDEPTGGTTRWQGQAARISPITKVVHENGLYAPGGAMGGNPIAGVRNAGFLESKYKEFLSIFEGRYSPIKDLNLKANVSYYTYDLEKKDRTIPYSLYDEDGDLVKTENLVTRLSNESQTSYRVMLQFVSDYSLTLNDSHNLKFLGGYSQEYNKSEGFWASRENLPFDDIHVIQTGNSNRQNGGNASDVAIMSVFGRVNYDYLGKYLFEANVRADGSSRFASGHRWGAFPSFSAGWNIHAEEFMKSSASWLSQLKLRASWGQLGDAEKIGEYATAMVLNYNPSMYSFNGVLAPGAFNNKAIDPTISWEKAQMTNIGIDLGFLSQRLAFTAEYFLNKRTDILYQPPVPLEFGLNAPYMNALKMENRGMEFGAMYNDRKGDFNWGVDFNMSFSKNKVLEMGAAERWLEGDGIYGSNVTYLNDRYNLPYGYEVEGIFQSQDEIDKAPTQTGAKPGNLRFKNQNDDNRIDSEDRVVLSRRVPINFGGNLRFGYKDIDLSMNFYGRLNVEKYMSGAEGWAFFISDNARPMHLDSWTTNNPNASYPRLTLSDTANDTQYNSFWLRKSDYLKLQNIQVGYTLPKSVLEKLRLQYLRIYASGQNLATITNYEGFDPEGGWYPLSRTFSLGFNLKF